MNATYLLLFTTNTNEGTKRNVQTTGPEKSNKKNFEHCGKAVTCTRENWITV